MKEYISKNIDETGKIAQELVASLKGGEVLALSGNLGAGKTVFSKAVAKYLGVKENVTSPTFVLMKVYDLDSKKISTLVHVDCYRLGQGEDLNDVGLGDYLRDSKTVTIIEWADKVSGLPDTTISINIENLGEDNRKITID